MRWRCNQACSEAAARTRRPAAAVIGVRRSTNGFTHQRPYWMITPLAHAVGGVGAVTVPGLRQPDGQRPGRAFEHDLVLDLAASRRWLAQGVVAAADHVGGAVVGREVVEHPRRLDAQREVGQRLGNLRQRRVDVPAAARWCEGPTALTLMSSRTASTPSCLVHRSRARTGCSTNGANAVSLLIRLKIRCERPSSKSDRDVDEADAHVVRSTPATACRTPRPDDVGCGASCARSRRHCCGRDSKSTSPT